MDLSFCSVLGSRCSGLGPPFRSGRDLGSLGLEALLALVLRFSAASLGLGHESE